MNDNVKKEAQQQATEAYAMFLTIRVAWPKGAVRFNLKRKRRKCISYKRGAAS